MQVCAWWCACPCAHMYVETRPTLGSLRADNLVCLRQDISSEPGACCLGESRGPANPSNPLQSVITHSFLHRSGNGTQVLVVVWQHSISWAISLMPFLCDYYYCCCCCSLNWNKVLLWYSPWPWTSVLKSSSLCCS